MNDRGLLVIAAVVAVCTLVLLVLLAFGPLHTEPDCRPAGHTVGCER